MDVYAMKTRATYSCSAADSIEANWFLNGSDYRDLNLTNITAFFFDRTNVGIFIFKYLTGVYNNTHIQCEAIFSTKSPVRSGNNKTLIIQGKVSHFLYYVLNRAWGLAVKLLWVSTVVLTHTLIIMITWKKKVQSSRVSVVL